MAEFQRPIHILKGRGTASRLASRFDASTRQGWDDGWGAQEDEGELARVATTVRFEECRSAINRNDSPDIHFDQ